jgi:soluble lytic murein transglycosylase
MDPRPTTPHNVPPGEPPGQMARVPDVHANIPPEQAGETRVLMPEQPPAHKRRSLAARVGIMAATVLAVAVLVGGATWWYLTRQGEGGNAVTPPPASGTVVPHDTIALINSVTPIVPELRNPTGGLNVPLDLDAPPDTAGRTPAVHQAHAALEEGRYSSAISQFSALVGAGAAGEARDALWGLAQTYEREGSYDLAARSYSLFARLDDTRAPAAYVSVGRVYERLGRLADAAEIYGTYAATRAPGAHAVGLMQAALLGNTEEAEEAYRRVIDGKPLDADLRAALSGLAGVKAVRGDHEEALELYTRLAEMQAADPRPVLDNRGRPAFGLAADAARELGREDEAAQDLIAYVLDERSATYPLGRYSALQTLEDIRPTVVASGTVPPMPAARIAWDAGYTTRAIEYMDILRSGNPASPERPAAALLTGRAFDRLGDMSSAYNWYTATVQTYPTAPEAAEAARRAGDALVEQALWDEALGTYKQAAETYPNAGDQTYLARVNGAVLAYRLEDGDTTWALLEPLLAAEGISPTIKAEAIFWAGKLQKKRGESGWRDTLEQVEPLAPNTYTAFRARSILDGEPDGGPVALTFSEAGVDAANLGVDFEGELGERAEMLSWASSLTSTVPATATVTVTPAGGEGGEGGADPEVERAAALLRLGFDDAGYTAVRAAAERMTQRGDYHALARLVSYLRYHAGTFTSMLVAEMLAGEQGERHDLPALLLKTVYPTPYEGLVLGEARERDIDPLLMYALMRQESQFVPDALSHAEARGLAQVIPSTGQGIADALGDTGYSTEDLFLPHVSIRYGTYYLASNLPQFERKILPALAAYNGGPGNAARWLQGSALFDPDLFIERVDLFETEDYLRRVYHNFGFYELLYR